MKKDTVLMFKHERVCLNCEYARLDSENPDLCICHRHAPRPMTGEGWTWPIVRWDDFCGEFENFDKERKENEEKHN